MVVVKGIFGTSGLIDTDNQTLFENTSESPPTGWKDRAKGRVLYRLLLQLLSRAFEKDTKHPSMGEVAAYRY